MSARVARAVDVALSATERLSQSTQRSSDAMRWVCAASDSSPPRGHAVYAERADDEHAEHDPGQPRGASAQFVPCAYATIWSSTCGVTGPNCDATTTPSGPIAYVSGWPRVPKSSAAFAPGSNATGHVTFVVLHVAADRRSWCPRARCRPATTLGSSLCSAYQDDAARRAPGGTGCTTSSRSSRAPSCPRGSPT